MVIALELNMQWGAGAKAALDLVAGTAIFYVSCGEGINCLNIPALPFWVTRFLKLAPIPSPVIGSSDIWKKARFHKLKIKSQPRFLFALEELGARRLRT